MNSASGLLGGHAYFLHWGVIQLSLANFLVIVTMILLFVLALVVPFPGHHAAAADHAPKGRADDHRPSA